MKAILWVGKNGQGDHYVEDFFVEDGAYKEPEDATGLQNWFDAGWELVGTPVFTTEKDTTVVVLCRE